MNKDILLDASLGLLFTYIVLHEGADDNNKFMTTLRLAILLFAMIANLLRSFA